MKLLAATFLSALISLTTVLAAWAAPSSFQIESGEVIYKVDVKILGGIGSQQVSAKNRAVSGELNYQDQQFTGKLIIPLKKFESGNSTQDEHVLGILKGEKYPEIAFSLENLTLNEDDLARLLAQEKGTAKVNGTLSVMGVSKTYDFDLAIAKLDESRYRLSTQKELKFTDFGMAPPSYGGFLSNAPDQFVISGAIVVRVGQ